MYIFMPSNYDVRIFAALYNWALSQPVPFTDNLPLEKNVCSLLYVRLGLVIKVTWKSKKVTRKGYGTAGLGCAKPAISEKASMIVLVLVQERKDF